MTGRVTTAQGAVYELPALLAWRLRCTGGVPCDSFTVQCLYSAAMADVMKQACRFAAVEDGETVFTGVVDEWCAKLDGTGLVLTVSGRGMAALLLDNEAESAAYQRPALREIVRDYVTPCGVVCAPHEEVRAAGGYAVASGTSCWRAVGDFARRCGLRPQFTRDGALCFRAAGEGARHMLGAGAPVVSAAYRDRRYGVLSEVVTIDRTRGTRQTVRNEAFLTRGGSCRRIVYVPSRSGNELRYTGRYQIERSAEGARELTLTLAGRTAAEPRDYVELRLEKLGLAGTYRVSEVVRALTARGETTELVLWEE